MTENSTHGHVVFETVAGDPVGIANTEDIAFAALHEALDLAAHSNDREWVENCILAHDELNGDAAPAVTRHALLWLVTEIFDQLYSATPSAAKAIRAHLLQQAKTYGAQRQARMGGETDEGPTA